METNTTNEKAGMNMCGAMGCGCGHHHMHIMKWLLKIALVIVVFCFAFQMGELKGMLRSQGMYGGYSSYGRGDMMYHTGMMENQGTMMTIPPTGATTPVTPTH